MNDETKYIVTYKAGRCANGVNASAGHVLHAIPEKSETALCGAVPGRQSAGWGWPQDAAPTCKRCQRKIKKVLQ